MRQFVASILKEIRAEHHARKQEAAELRALRKKYKVDKKAIKQKHWVTMTHH